VGRALTAARAWPAGDLGGALSGGFHGAWDTNAGGYIWKDHQRGAEDVLLDLLPRRLLPIAKQLLGAGAVQAPTSEDCAVFFAADGDVSSLATLRKVQAQRNKHPSGHGSVAWSLCPTTQSGIANIFGTAFAEATIRPGPRSTSTTSCRTAVARSSGRARTRASSTTSAGR
jgi:hypothetical protein